MRKRKLAGVCLVVVLSVVLGSPSLATTWWEHYQRGEEALQQQDWRLAIDQLCRAIEERPESGADIRLRSKQTVHYFPYLKLGIAYYNVGQFAAALGTFEIEEDLAAIEGSATDERNLQSFHRLAQDAQRGEGRSRQERVAAFVREALEDATRLEADGRLDEAMSSVGKALAIAPGDGDALDARERLGVRLAELERERNNAERQGALVAEGKRLAASGDLGEAASKLRQALSISEDAEIRSLLDGAQQQLRLQVQAERDAEQRRNLIADALADATRLELDGRPGEALDALEPVLALEPDNALANTLRVRLAQAQEVAERERALEQHVAGLLQQGAELVGGGRFDEALTRLNLVLALDPANEVAAQWMEQVMNSLADAKLTAGDQPHRPKVPPTVALVNAMRLLADTGDSEEDAEIDSGREEKWSNEERTYSPDYLLAGLVLDDQPRISLSLLKVDPSSGDYTTVVARELTGERFGETLFRFSFSEQVHLDPGLAAWKVVVTDADGLSSEAGHAVRYSRPWTRSPWIWSIAVAGVVAAGAGYQLRRMQLRRRLLRRHFNPYVAGAPVLDEGLFFGREDLMLRVLQSIHNNSMMLYGERRIGKTSFQHALKRRLTEMNDPEWTFYPVYIDLQGTPQDKFFLTIADEIFAELSDSLETQHPRETRPYDYRALVRDIRDVLGALRGRSEKKVKLCLLIDEVDELNAYDPRINQRLRSLFMKSFAENLVAVVTGVRIKKHWESEGSPWYNFFEEVEVRPFTRHDAEVLIQQPLRGAFRLDRGVVDRIITHAGCRPYLIQKVCVELINRSHQEGRRRITVSDVDAVVRAAEG